MGCGYELVQYCPLWTLITENAESQIRHYCMPLQIVRQKPNIENYNEALNVLFI